MNCRKSSNCGDYGSPRQGGCGAGHRFHFPFTICDSRAAQSSAQAERAIAAGADYIAIGPIYATGTKPTAKPVTLDYVRWAAANVHVPWFAIGGINLTTLGDVLAAGAGRICVVSAILNAPDVAAECRKFQARMGDT